MPDTAQVLIGRTAMLLPHVKSTELLLEVDEWTGFKRHFSHLKSGDVNKDKTLVLTAILAMLSTSAWPKWSNPALRPSPSCRGCKSGTFATIHTRRH